MQILLSQLNTAKTRSKRADVQLVFCIDVRSEPYRRAIEQLGNYETLGFAGFFGLPIRVKDYDSGKMKESYPVLLKPRFNIEEKPISSYEGLAKSNQKIKNISHVLKAIYQQLKCNFSTPFALAESLGLWCGIAMLLKSINSFSLFSNKILPVIKPTIETEPVCEADQHLESGINLNEQITYADITLKLMGLTENFAKIIILCGHGSSTQNNPYASALDCGACGGNHGGVNAKLLAQILNKQTVRQKLQEKGINIPLDTIFLGAQHDTTTDTIKIYFSDKSRSNYPALLEQLMKDLEKAKAKNHIERSQNLQGFNTVTNIERRSTDWSETRPEWGLARNAAFIIAPRFLTENVNLNGRCFLHSYHWDQDADGSLLETILTAPMVVAQWINAQYLFSTVNNVMYGSGSKITHNVIGKIGIVQGNGSDLMHGLPLQSVMNDDKTAYHSPQRLLTIVYGKRAVVSDIIAKQSILKTLFFNDWVHLMVIEPINNLPYKLELNGEWKLAY
ncbi:MULTISPECIES: putative inorganic carbon transporter subunit DabA [unclassified Legionella]|uniref:putative inorganic carbon transporter subunit DabA n=1 Tax=unclassified Legionella TaxID=2622702 RepID=UPI002414DD1B|nr:MULTISPECIES: putative inorganic carbon transporter subunit DabA [unclassified Legionella]MDI9819813.1 Na-translocating system protein MpsB [Legionella sp. PL877]